MSGDISREASDATSHSEHKKEAGSGVQEVVLGRDSEAGSSTKGRRETLFLGDTEKFVFDFGGASEDTDCDVEGLAANQQTPREAELADLISMTAGQSKTLRPLSPDDVQRYSSKALSEGARRFFTFQRVEGEDRRGKKMGREARQSGESLDKLVSTFCDALRKYDEELWRAHMQKLAEGTKKPRW